MDGLIFAVLIYSLNKHTCVINMVTIKTFFFFIIYSAHCVVLNTMCTCDRWVDDKIHCIKRFELPAVIITIRGSCLLGSCMYSLV